MIRISEMCLWLVSYPNPHMQQGLFTLALFSEEQSMFHACNCILGEFLASRGCFSNKGNFYHQLTSMCINMFHICCSCDLQRLSSTSHLCLFPLACPQPPRYSQVSCFDPCDAELWGVHIIGYLDNLLLKKYSTQLLAVNVWRTIQTLQMDPQ